MTNYENNSSTLSWAVTEVAATTDWNGTYQKGNLSSFPRSCPPPNIPEKVLKAYYADIIVLSIVFVLAMFGNLCVLFAVWRRRAKSKRMHLFIVHLALADIIVALFQVLPELLQRLTCGFHASDGMCRLVKYLQIVGMYGSTYVLVCTAMDRYVVIKYPMKTIKQSKKRVHLAIALVWILSLILSTPQLFFFGVEKGQTICKMIGMPPTGQRIYVTWYFMSVLVFPVSMLVFSYGMIAYIIFTNFKQKRRAAAPTRTPIKPSQGEFAPRASNIKIVSRAKLKTVKMMFVIVILFAVCYIPFFTVQMLGVWKVIERNALVSQIIHLLASLNSCVNPWVYMGFSGHLLAELKPPFCTEKERRQTSRSFRSTAATNVMSSSFISRFDSAPCHQEDHEYVALRTPQETRSMNAKL